jgi:hypothetical protein
LLHQEKLSSKIGGEIKTFQDKQKLKQFMSTKPASIVEDTDEKESHKHVSSGKNKFH